MKICVTDATFKHAQALARYLHLYDPQLEIIGVTPVQPRFPLPYARHFSRLAVGELPDVIGKESPDLIIPVGNRSVECVSAMGTSKALLPDPDSLAIALDKEKTVKLAMELGIPVPQTYVVENIKELDTLETAFPCVVKGVIEAGKNMVAYPKNRLELATAFHTIMNTPSQRGHLPVVQEYVPGVGLGFFGFYQNGVLKRFYMHQRIREFPITGGASTAAKTIFHPEAFRYGKLILDHLKWNGVAMVEFKFNMASGGLALMEINPKFWGSTELGLAAGVNFGELLVRASRGEEIPPDLSPDSYKEMKFFWPCDGDLLAIAQSRNWKTLLEYVRGGYATNVKANGFLLNIISILNGIRAGVS